MRFLLPFILAASLYAEATFNPKLDFAPSDAVASLEQAITPQTKLIKPVSSDPAWWEYLLVILSFGLVFWLWKLRSKPAPVKPVVDTPTPKPTYSTPAEDRYVSSMTTFAKPSVPTPTATHTEHHHYHSSDSGISTLGTVAVAAGTAAVVSSMMHDHSSPIIIPTHSYQPESISTSWDEPTPRSTISSSWNDTSARSTSWVDDTSSSRGSSWSDSSSLSSSWDSSSSSSSD